MAIHIYVDDCDAMVSVWNDSEQPALFQGTIPEGVRHFPTELDRAIVRDVG